MSSLPTLEEARTRGRAFREQCSRSALGVLNPRPDSYDPVARLMWQGESRVSALLPIRYQRMLSDPFSFYRGTALVMAEDLARGVSSALEVQISGDAHLSNFNLFSSPERHQVFDINDFDETDVGPFEWDVKRLMSSLVVASQHLGHSRSQQEMVALDAAREYRTSIRRFALQTRLEIWYASLDVASTISTLGGFFTESALRKVDHVVLHASGTNTTKSFAKLVGHNKGGLHIVSNPPLLVPIDRLSDEGHLNRDELYAVVAGYAETLSSDRRALLRQFTPVDAARKVVGVGSVGTDCYVMLLVGRDVNDPFFLQIKQASSSAVAVALGRTNSVASGERVVRGQRMMQATPDVFLGWNTLARDSSPRDYYVRQLYDNKASIAIEHLDESLLRTYGRICAWVLARAHARSGKAAEIAGYLGKSDVADRALAAFAVAYRDRNLQDFAALRGAAKEGRITVAT